MSTDKKEEIDINDGEGDGDDKTLDDRQDSLIFNEDDTNADITERLLANIPNMLKNNSFKFIPKDISPPKGGSFKAKDLLGGDEISPAGSPYRLK